MVRYFALLGLVLFLLNLVTPSMQKFLDNVPRQDKMLTEAANIASLSQR